MLWAHSTTGDYIWKHRKKEWTHWHGVEADVIIKEKATSHSPSDYYSDRWFKRILIISIIIYSLTARVVGTPKMISQPASSMFPCFPLLSRTWRTPGLSIPWCCLPTSSSLCLVFLPLSLCLARWFWPDLMNGKHDHTTCSLRLFTMVRRSSCGPVACWILTRTSSLVTWSLYERCSILR